MRARFVTASVSEILAQLQLIHRRYTASEAPFYSKVGAIASGLGSLPFTFFPLSGYNKSNWDFP
jgi:hypothetical protein